MRAKFKWLLISPIIGRIMILVYLLPHTLEIDPSFTFPSSSQVLLLDQCRERHMEKLANLWALGAFSAA